MTTADWYLKIQHAQELADTMRFSLKARGAYFTLMLEYGREGGLPDDGEKVRTIAGASPRERSAIAAELQGKLFTCDWRHERWDRQMKTSRERAKAGREGGQARIRNTAESPPDYGEPPPYAYDETAAWEPEPAGRQAPNCLSKCSGNCSSPYLDFACAFAPSNA